MGKVSCLTASMTNAAFKNRAVRVLMERGTWIDRRWLMPTYNRRPVSKELAGRPKSSGETLCCLLLCSR